MAFHLFNGFYETFTDGGKSVNEARNHLIHVYMGKSCHLTFVLTELSLTNSDYV